MSLTRPILISVPSFDASQTYTFTFAIQAGSAQITQNKLTIRKQEDNVVVYEQTQQSFKYEHTVPADTLQNGVYYNAYISVFDAEKNESPSSIPIQFWCYSTPTIGFTNMPLNNIISNASFNFEFVYNQNEGEALNSYEIKLYNASQNWISTSGVIYATQGKPPYTGNYLFAGFEDNTVYYIEIIGITVNNSVVQSAKEQITAKYTRPDIFTLIELKNNCEEGYISLRSNLILIEGESNPEPPIYINNEEIDLSNPDHWVKWEKGYKINGDFAVGIWLRKPTPYSDILQFSNTEGQTIRISYMLGYENEQSTELKSFYEVHINSIEGIDYYIFSTFVETLSDTFYYNVWLSRKNNIYQIIVNTI